MKFRILIYGVLIVAAVIAACGNDNSTQPTTPTITSITPASVQPGQQNVAGTITGTNFGTGAATVNMGDGITVSQATVSSSTQIAIVFSVSNSATAGARTITVQVSTGTFTSGSIFSVNPAAPVANFTAAAVPDTEGKWHFDASPSLANGATITTYFWQFGDKSQTKGKIVDHKYLKSGNYDVNLKVTNNYAQNDTKNKQVKVEIGGGGDGGSCGYIGNCSGFENLQRFEIVKVEGPPNAATITSDRDLFNCHSGCPEVRRLHASGTHEFLGDVFRGTLTCRTMKLKVYGLPGYQPPQVGEQVYLVFKGC